MRLTKRLNYPICVWDAVLLKPFRVSVYPLGYRLLYRIEGLMSVVTVARAPGHLGLRRAC